MFDGQALFPKLGTGGVKFQGRVVVKVDNGEVEAAGETVRVKHADAVTIVADVRTDYKNGQYASLCEKTVGEACGGLCAVVCPRVIEIGRRFQKIRSGGPQMEGPLRRKQRCRLAGPVLPIRSLPDHCFFA